MELLVKDTTIIGFDDETVEFTDGDYSFCVRNENIEGDFDVMGYYDLYLFRNERLIAKKQDGVFDAKAS